MTTLSRSRGFSEKIEISNLVMQIPYVMQTDLFFKKLKNTEFLILDMNVSDNKCSVNITLISKTKLKAPFLKRTRKKKITKKFQGWE